MIALLTLMLSAPQATPAPERLPPEDSPPLVHTVEIAFPARGGASLVEPETYLYYIHTKPSRPSANEWTPYDPQTTLDDFRRLWATGFLENLSIDVRDELYENGVAGKHIVFNLEERPRVKIVNYVGSKTIATSQIEERLKAVHAQIVLESFIDARHISRVEGIVREMLREQGFQFASVTP